MSLETLHAQSSILDIAYETGPHANGMPVMLFHGWPDDIRTFDGIRPALDVAGFRTIVPWLRGCGPTRFRTEATPRSGQIAAMAQDALDLADALGIERFSIVGHDWGARIAYFIASAAPERLDRMVALSLGWEPGPLKTPALNQARAFWYQWFMATERGAEVVRRDGAAFARFMWETWSPGSPPGWFDDATFAVTARSFENPDWAAITLHSYRVRWGQAESDPRYTALEQRQREARSIPVPTLLIHGGDDRCVQAWTSEHKDAFFTGGYERHVLDGIGHFPTREAPQQTAALITQFLRR